MTDWDAARDLISIVAGKWALRVLVALNEAPRRYNDLLRVVNHGVSRKVLTDTLHRLGERGLVRRTVIAHKGPEAYYALTAQGRAVMEPLSLVAEWANDHWDVTGRPALCLPE